MARQCSCTATFWYNILDETFNTLLYINEMLETSRIAYLTVNDAPTILMDCINNILHRSVEYADILELNSIIAVFDQSIYAKAQEIGCASELLYKKNLAVHLGVFHIAIVFLAPISKRFSGSELPDLMIEAELVAKGSIIQVVDANT